MATPEVHIKNKFEREEHRKIWQGKWKLFVITFILLCFMAFLGFTHHILAKSDWKWPTRTNKSKKSPLVTLLLLSFCVFGQNPNFAPIKRTLTSNYIKIMDFTCIWYLLPLAFNTNFSCNLVSHTFSIMHIAQCLPYTL